MGKQQTDKKARERIGGKEEPLRNRAFKKLPCVPVNLEAQG